MSIKQYLIFLASGTAIAICAWFIVLISINPVTAGFFGFLGFYITLFFSLLGIFTTLGTLLRLTQRKHIAVETLIKTSLRQALLLAILVEGSIIFLGKGHLSLTTVIICILVISSIEFLFLSIEGRTHKHP